MTHASESHLKDATRAAETRPDPETLQRLHTGFEAAMPRIIRHAQVAFRNYKEEKREDATEEALAICWKWYRELSLAGREPDSFISSLATFACKQVRDGRTLCGQQKIKDVMSPRAQKK